jgi:RNA polymerase sigma factor (sigma-70 family)
VGLTGIEPVVADTDEGLLALDEALQKLADKDTAKAQLVKLRYFAGLTLDQAAHALGISRSTAYEHWAYARAWLRVEMTKGDDATP